MLCNTIPQLFKTLRVNSFPLRLNTTPQRNISCICLSKTLLFLSALFRRTSCLSSSVTTLVYSMFFPRNSSFFQTILLRVNSMRFLCYSQPFESFLRLHITSLCTSIPLLHCSLLLNSITALFSAAPFHYLTLLHFTIPLPNQSSPLPIIAIPFLSPIYQTSRLSLSCCSQVSDSLAVCSSHRGNLYIRC